MKLTFTFKKAPFSAFACAFQSRAWNYASGPWSIHFITDVVISILTSISSFPRLVQSLFPLASDVIEYLWWQGSVSTDASPAVEKPDAHENERRFAPPMYEINFIKVKPMILHFILIPHMKWKYPLNSPPNSYKSSSFFFR